MKKWGDLRMKGRYKHRSITDYHRCLSQSEESKCTWTHSKDGAMWPPFPHGVNALLT